MPNLKFSLLQRYYASWYGCRAWRLGTSYCDPMNVEWRKAVRRTAGLPRQTRSVLLPGLAGIENFLSQQERRFARLFNTMSASNNPAICFLAPRVALSAVEVLGRNRVWRGAISDEAPMVEQIHKIVSWCVPGMDWCQLTFLNLRILHWYLNS